MSFCCSFLIPGCSSSSFQACYLRGINSHGLQLHQCREWLSQWLQVSSSLKGCLTGFLILKYSPFSSEASVFLLMFALKALSFFSFPRLGGVAAPAQPGVPLCQLPQRLQHTQKRGLRQCDSSISLFIWSPDSKSY